MSSELHDCKSLKKIGKSLIKYWGLIHSYHFINVIPNSRVCNYLSDTLLPWQLPFSARTIHPLVPWQFTPYWCDFSLFNILTFYHLLAWHFTIFYNDTPLNLQFTLNTVTIFCQLQWPVIICDMNESILNTLSDFSQSFSDLTFLTH